MYDRAVRKNTTRSLRVDDALYKPVSTTRQHRLTIRFVSQ